MLHGSDCKIINGMEATRALMANELRSYREAIAQVMRSARPGVEVHETEPEQLDWEVARLRPNFVVCSRVTSMVVFLVPVWVELYSYCQATSRVSVRGGITRVDSVQLADLLALLDQTQSLAAPG